MLVLKNIDRSFNGTKVLKNLNIEFKSGLNFIVGPSGCGKSTLLKIISGMDKEYAGEVFFKGKNLKGFNEEELNSYYYNSVGFIWQNFQLINHLTVEDNVRMVLELSNFSDNEKKKMVSTILKRVGIESLAKKSVSKLSGGQKQRVAIARALVKNPEIIIADEPTGALDKKTSAIIMGALKKIAKDRLVIVVTHDKSLVSDDSNCFLLKDGVISQVLDGGKEKEVLPKKNIIKPYLSLIGATKLGLKNFKGLALKFILTSLILVLSSYFLLLNFSGTIVNEQQEILKDLIDKKGDMLRDIDIVSNAIGGSSMEEEDGNKASIDIEQDVSNSLNKYKNDERIEFVMPLLAVSNMKVTIDGLVSNYELENSNTIPVVNKIVEGRMPNQDGREVAVSKLFLERAKLKAEYVLGKKINISGEGYDWSTGQPEIINQEVNDVTIVGIIDSSVKSTLPNGEVYEYELEDSFIFGMDVAKELKKQINSSTENLSFKMRVKNIEDIMSIVEELQLDGITPIGEFESVKDILNINNVTEEQSNIITMIISIVAVIIILAVVIINAYLRKTEFAILKINGYSKRSLLNLNIMEYMIISIISIAIFIVLYPGINSVSTKLLSISAVGTSSLMIGSIIILCQGFVLGIISGTILLPSKIGNSLTTGDR